MNVRQPVQNASKGTAQQIADFTKSGIFQWMQYAALCFTICLILLDVVLPLLGYSRSSDLFWDRTLDKGFVLAWVWGVLAGHLFIARDRDARILSEVSGICILAVVSLILLGLAYFYGKDSSTLLNVMLLGIGCVAGHYLWPQSSPEAISGGKAV